MNSRIVAVPAAGVVVVVVLEIVVVVAAEIAAEIAPEIADANAAAAAATTAVCHLSILLGGFGKDPTQASVLIQKGRQPQERLQEQTWLREQGRQ